MTITSGSTTQGASDNIFHKATLHLPYILTMPPISNGRHCMLLLHRYSELPYICRLVLKKRVTLKAERDGRGRKKKNCLKKSSVTFPRGTGIGTLWVIGHGQLS